MTNTSSAGSFRLQRAFALAFAAIRARWAPMLVAALLLGYMPAAAHDWFTSHYTAESSVEILHPPPPPPNAAPRATATAQIGNHAGHLGPWEMFVDAGPLVTWFPLEFLCSVALSGALASLTISHAHGARAPWRRAARDTVMNLLPLILISVFRAALTLAGAILVVPGLIVYAAWVLARPAQIAERTGVIGSLRRSAELTRDHRLVILGLAALWLVVFLVLGMITGVAPAMFGFPRLAAFDRPVVGTLAGVFYDVLIAALYLELRRAKEGVAVGELDQVFA